MTKYGIEAFEPFEGKWKKKHSAYPITKKSFGTESEAKTAMNMIVKRIKKANKKAEMNFNREGYGTTQIPKLRVREKK